MPSRAWHCDAGVGGALRLSQEGRAGGAAVPAWRRVGFITAASCAGLSCREGCEEPQLGQLLLLEASSLLEPLLSALGSPAELLGAACSLRCPMARLLWGRRVPHRCSVAALPCSPCCAAGLGALSGLCSTSCMRCWEPTGQRLHVVLQPTKGSLRALPARSGASKALIPWLDAWSPVAGAVSAAEQLPWLSLCSQHPDTAVCGAGRSPPWGSCLDSSITRDGAPAAWEQLPAWLCWVTASIRPFPPSAGCRCCF